MAPHAYGEEENERASKTIDELPKALEGLKDSAQDLLYDPQKEHEAKNLGTGEYCWSIRLKTPSPNKYLGREHDKQTPSAHNETLKTDDTLIQKQMPEEREDSLKRESKSKVQHANIQGSKEKQQELFTWLGTGAYFEFKKKRNGFIRGNAQRYLPRMDGPEEGI